MKTLTLKIKGINNIGNCIKVINYVLEQRLYF